MAVTRLLSPILLTRISRLPSASIFGAWLECRAGCCDGGQGQRRHCDDPVEPYCDECRLHIDAPQRPLREINPAVARLAFVFPVPLDHVSRLLFHCFLPACFFVASVSQAVLAENSPRFSPYANPTCPRPARPSSSRLHLIMFRVCFFIWPLLVFSFHAQCRKCLSPKTRRKYGHSRQIRKNGP